MTALSEAWGQATVEGDSLGAQLALGDYWYTWGGTEPDAAPGQSLHAEVRRALAGCGLALESDDQGMRVVRREAP